MGRAVEFLARKKFGDEWSPTLVGAKSANLWEAETPEARSKLAVFALENSVLIESYKLPNTDFFFSIEDEIAPLVRDGRFSDADIERMKIMNRKILVQRRRFDEIVKIIAGWVADRDLCFATRLREGGLVNEDDNIGPWNTETNLGEFFNDCQIKLRAGVDFEKRSVYDCYYIFVEKDAFYRLCAECDPPDQLNPSEVHFSPYLKVMLRVAKMLAITPENQPKKIEVIAELQARWPVGVAHSANLVEAMATLLREPESQLGRAKKLRSTADENGVTP